MPVAIWEVLGKRTEGDEFAVVGGLKAPDAEMALLLARDSGHPWSTDGSGNNVEDAQAK